MGYAKTGTPTKTTPPARRVACPASAASRVSKRKRTADYTLQARQNVHLNQDTHIGASLDSVEVIDLTGSSPVPEPSKKSRASKNPKTQDESIPERRARVFRKHAPKTFLERLHRATTQRMYVVGHTVTTNAEDTPEMSFDIVGTTGNIYKTTIGKEPTCDCPDARKGNQCKHICYVNVLKAPSDLQYQLAFLSIELREIYQHSPLSQEQPKAEDNGGNRKPVEGDCPICFMEFEPEKEEIVWCRAACGNNIHKTCFQQWAATQRAQGVRCVYCRSPWQAENSAVNIERLMRDGTMNQDGYVNVAGQMGLSGKRGMRPSLYLPLEFILRSRDG
ncbi:hypothetical protein FE257_013052 [Aspergillus nanangensis]|uniref:RING finger domain protein n=1 Tax=Aspergillus nanangensis TaxID=2582783 RepID=A0AAD4CF24_ASPNN|nr:hypothetical protein FE257_013052 [Aspergillus nanangensis]